MYSFDLVRGGASEATIKPHEGHFTLLMISTYWALGTFHTCVIGR